MLLMLSLLRLKLTVVVPCSYFTKSIQNNYNQFFVSAEVHSEPSRGLQSEKYTQRLKQSAKFKAPLIWEFSSPLLTAVDTSVQ